jgi:hypothetical protein
MGKKETNKRKKVSSKKNFEGEWNTHTHSSSTMIPLSGAKHKRGNKKMGRPAIGA